MSPWASALRGVFFIVGVAGAAACEQQFPSNPPPAPPRPPSAGDRGPDAEERLLAAASVPATASLSVSRAMTITSCTWSPSACPGNDGGAETRYRVVFGSGHGEIRSQGQAKADLYTEIRDRTQAGEWLDAESRTPASSCGPRDLGRGSAPVSKASGDGDPLTQCALTLLDLVDGGGEVGIDVIHGGLPEARTPDGGAAPGCSVSLGRQTGPDAMRCLVEAPERAHRPGR